VIKIKVNLEVTISEIYAQIPWELVMDPVGSMEHTLGTTV